MSAMRKVCNGMSKQRYILIVFILGFSLLSGQLHVQNHSELWFGTGRNTPDILVKDHLSLSYPVSSTLRWSFENDLLRRDYKVEDQTQRLYNSLATSISYNRDGSFAKAAYRNTLFGDATGMNLYPVTQALREYDKEMQNNFYLALGQSLGILNLRAETMLKGMTAKRWEYELDMDTFELNRNRISDTTFLDWNAGLQALLRTESGVWVYAGYQHSGHDRDEATTTPMRSSELGLGYNIKLANVADLDANIDWQHRQSGIIASERTNLYNSHVRLRGQLTPQLSLSLSYANHLCSDAKAREILLISNYLRTVLKYSLAYDAGGSSYLLAGAKYSPENDADAIFTDLDLKLINALWVGCGLLWSPENFVEYNASTAYRLGVYNALRINYRYRENTADSGLWRYIGIGVDYYY